MISVIVPVYNVEAYIEQCINSILKQAYSDLEILLIDDGSPDRCGLICDKYAEIDKRIRVFHTDNRGLSSARNLGLSKAVGDYIAFVDSDDWIEPDMYGTLLSRLEETYADVCICGYFSDSASASKIHSFEEVTYNNRESFEALINGKIISYAWNKLYRKTAIEGLLFPMGKYYEDNEFFCNALSRSNIIAGVSSPKYHYRQRNNSISKNHAAKNLVDYADACLYRYNFFKKQYTDLFHEKEEVAKKSVSVGIARVWRWWHKCQPDEKQSYGRKIKELVQFSRDNLPLFGYASWPIYLRMSTLFMHSSSRFSFAVLYYLNMLFQKKIQD